MATSVDHPRLIRTDAESIRVFLKLYDQYSNEVKARAQQLTTVGSSSTQVVRPVSLKFCVDPEYLESAIAFGFIEAETYEDLTDSVLRKYLEKKAEESPEAITLEAIDSIVDRDLRMNMGDKNARSRMESLVVSYHTLLRRHGLSWILKSNQKVAVMHVLSAVKPTSLRNRLQSDLDFAHHDLKENFKGFLSHSLKVSDAFQLVDQGPKQGRKDTKGTKSGNRSGNNANKSSSSESPHTLKVTKYGRSLPACPYGP